MDKIIKRFDRYITILLLISAMLFTILLMLELFWATFENIRDRITTDLGLEFVPEHGKIILVLFFNVLLVLEIIATIRVFDKEPIVKIKVILIVCLIAISRKILTLDFIHSQLEAELGIAALILSVATGYYLISRSEQKNSKPDLDA